MILACIQESPNSRPSSYEDLFGLLKATDVNNHKSNLSDFEITGKANVLLKQGKAQDAINLLQSFLIEEKNNALVLTTLGTLYAKLGKNEDAEFTYIKACAVLDLTKGMHRDKPLTLPYANLALLYITQSRFEDASKTIQPLLHLGSKFDPSIHYMCPEIGWYHLYQGNFDKSQKLLLTAFRSAKPNPFNMCWLILSLFLSGKLEIYNFDLFIVGKFDANDRKGVKKAVTHEEIVSNEITIMARGLMNHWQSLLQGDKSWVEKYYAIFGVDGKPYKAHRAIVNKLGPLICVHQ